MVTSAAVGSSGESEADKAKTATESYHVALPLAVVGSSGKSNATQAKNFTGSPRGNLVSPSDNGVTVIPPVVVGDMAGL